MIAEARGLGEPPYTDCNSPASHSAFNSVHGCLQFIAKVHAMVGLPNESLMSP